MKYSGICEIEDSMESVHRIERQMICDFICRQPKKGRSSLQGLVRFRGTCTLAIATEMNIAGAVGKINAL